MSLCTLPRNGSKIRVSIEVASLVFAVMAICGEAASAAPNSWSGRPSWATGDEQSGRKPTYRDTGYQIAPFTPGSNNLALDVGQVFLMGDLGSNYADAIGSQLHYTYGVSDMFGFDASFGYSNHSDGKYSLTTLLTGLRMNLSWYDKVIPYVVFGLGFYKPYYELTPLTTLSPVVFGLHAGPGVNLELTRNLFFGASLTFHDIFGTVKSTADGKRFEVDGTYTSFYLNAGVTF